MTTKISKRTIIFVDIRGFTRLCDSGFVVLSINDLIVGFQSLVEKCFGDAHIKHLGDGSLILMEEEELKDILEMIFRLRSDFDGFCNSISQDKGIEINLKLGFGLTKGDVIEMQKEYKAGNIVLKDYISPKINLASRLCGLARPSGLIVHKESFPQMPKEFADRFTLVQIRNINGLERQSEVRCHVEKTVELPTTATEIREMNIEVHVTGLCFHDDKLLLCKRALDRDIGAAKWAGPGGKVLPNSSFEDSLKDIFRREVGIDICDLRLIESYFIESHKIPGLRYYCRVSRGEPFNADKQNSEVRLFTREEVATLVPDLLPSLDVIRKAFDINQEYQRLNTRLRIIVSQECNLNCKFCHGDNVPGEYHTQLPNIMRSLERIRNNMHLADITISGGEPLTEKNTETVLDLCANLRSSSNVPISIVTNGLTLTIDLLRSIRKLDVKLKISIYGADSADFQEYTGSKFDRYSEHIAEILKQIQDFQIPYSLNVLSRRSFDKKLESFIGFLNSQQIFPQKIKIISMVPPRKPSKEFWTECMPLEDSVCYDESHTFVADKTFPHRRDLKFWNQNIELYEYPCRSESACARCFEKWGIRILPNGSLQICEKAMNAEIRKAIDNLDLPIVKWQFSARELSSTPPA